MLPHPQLMGTSRTKLAAVGCAAALALAAGCLTRQPPVRYPKSLRLTVALVRDDVYGREAHAVPAAVRAAVRQALAERNLDPTIDPPGLHEACARVRDTARRLEALASIAPGAEYLVLVETQARFYSTLNGVYRWTVSVKLTITEAGRARPSSRHFELPAALLYAHEQEAEALVAVAPEITRQLGHALDEYLGGPI
jgi:hypothetical protein